MKNFAIFLMYIFLVCALTASGCRAQSDEHQNSRNSPDKSKIVGGGCDGCELMYDGMPSNIKSVSYSPGWSAKAQKLLVTGTVYRLDGKTPAPNVIIYYWQTDEKGFYTPAPDQNKKTKRHGYIRGWVKTDAEGKYSIYTIRPAPYPNRDIPAHIHTSIKEPNIANEYYIDEFVFDDDKLLTGEKRRKLENRGGSGVLRVLLSGELQIAEHNIILGLNVPDYPEKLTAEKQSGLEIGEDSPSFTPFHAFGPDKNSRACPVCKYGRFHGILYFVGDNPKWDEIKKWLEFLERQSAVRGKNLKVYFVYGDENGYDRQKRETQLNILGEELALKNVALTFVPSMRDTESEVNLNKINPRVENTFVIFKQRNIIAKFIDLNPSDENFRMISKLLDESKGSYFHLSEPAHR